MDFSTDEQHRPAKRRRKYNRGIKSLIQFSASQQLGQNKRRGGGRQYFNPVLLWDTSSCEKVALLEGLPIFR
ncbi:hypothetical protein AV530_005695 [Patagioenas fasciata monilis]|uniref:Uncharacterized protein n=1 Tax=Patagioenas fasciata monilis TaxID=372326 RepID=A0A1V4JMQ2_PATFA|nr:hypothetical protein AV530_005695 [Patagioenas fasciata monilis]